VTARPPIAVVHLDESCLGNGTAGANPGGTGGLVEVRTSEGVQRRDLYLHDPDTTNNRMALAGATLTLNLLAGKNRRFRLVIVSDSQYLVKGMREWVSGWQARDWKRKSGPIENLEMWQSLVRAERNHDVEWTWVRGHKGHPKNEYVDHLAVQAAREQRSSEGTEPSMFANWLTAKRAKGHYLGYDPDEAFTSLERPLVDGEHFPLASAG
jgi:ribonuclease HI